MSTATITPQGGARSAMPGTRRETILSRCALSYTLDSVSHEDGNLEVLHYVESNYTLRETA